MYVYVFWQVKFISIELFEWGRGLAKEKKEKNSINIKILVIACVRKYYLFVLITNFIRFLGIF